MRRYNFITLQGTAISTGISDPGASKKTAFGPDILRARTGCVFTSDEWGDGPNRYGTNRFRLTISQKNEC